MSTRTKFFIALGLFMLLVGIALFTAMQQAVDSSQPISATINRDCAPWDGAAFTVMIPLQNMDISVSIYQAPDLKHPASFVFPGEIQQVGSALLIRYLNLNPPESLKGNISFQRVVEGLPVEGQFDLATNDGQQFYGKFRAEWGNEVVLCG